MDDGNPIVIRRMVMVDHKDMIGWTFLKDAKANGKRFLTQVVQAIVAKDNSELDIDTLLLYKFWRTALHQGPLQTSYMELVNTLEDNTQECGAMDRLNSEQILQALCICSSYIERYQKNHNFAENQHGTLKTASPQLFRCSCKYNSQQLHLCLDAMIVKQMQCVQLCGLLCIQQRARNEPNATKQWLNSEGEMIPTSLGKEMNKQL
jgi:hypothetical protein